MYTGLGSNKFSNLPDGPELLIGLYVRQDAL
jgi:hypothetical protein